MSELTVYGIKNCDTCRKALKWLDGQGRAYRWHDLRGDGLSTARVTAWLDAVGADMLVNRRSTTWRGLDDEARRAAMDPNLAVGILLEHPTLIKRPVFESGGSVAVGFNAAVRDNL
ncbi:MAG: arsenate reductase [Wenzhouxiangella sp.]|nr:MAG: arsenate reductase [Wenzhouxiangella sp.]